MDAPGPDVIYGRPLTPILKFTQIQLPKKINIPLALLRCKMAFFKLAWQNIKVLSRH